MSADQSIIDLTNETQDDINDDIQIVSQKLNDEPIIYKSIRKRRSPEILDVAGSSTSRPFKDRRIGAINIIEGPIEIVSDSIRDRIREEIEKQKSTVPIIQPGFDCPICLERHKENLVVTNCGHIFCKNCLKESFKASKHCPKCRKKLTAKSYHNIYL